MKKKYFTLFCVTRPIHCSVNISITINQMEQGKQIGDWKCLKLLGRGSFGSVGLWRNVKSGNHAGTIKCEMP